MPPSCSNRGAGKVLPRRLKEVACESTACCTPQPAHTTNDSSSDLTGSCDKPPIRATTSSNLARGNVQDPGTQLPTIDSLVPTRVTSPTPVPWRCHPMFQSQQQQVASIPPGKVHLGSSRRLLRAGYPVLLPSSNLVHVSHPDATTPMLNLPAATEGQAHIMHTAAGPVLVSQLPGTKLQEPVVLSSPPTSHVFLEADAAKNLAGSFYHVRRPETGRLQLAAAEALQCSSTWSKTKLYVKGLLAEWQIKQQPRTTSGSMLGYAAAPGTNTSSSAAATAAAAPAATAAAAAPAASNQASTSHLHLQVDTPTLAAVSQAVSAAAAPHVPAGSPHPGVTTAAIPDVPLLDPAAVAQLVAAGGWAPGGQLMFDFGQADALLPARYQLQDQVVCQVRGSRRVLLVAPADGLLGLYPYPVAHPYDTYSCVDLEAPELEHWRRADQVRGMVCDLRPGDALLVPGGWWVHTQLLQPNTCALTLQLHPGPERVATKGSLLLQLSRCIEAWTAGTVGVANTCNQLMAIAEGREWQALQLMTRKGVHKLELTHLVLRQLQQVLALPNGTPSEEQLMVLLQGWRASTEAQPAPLLELPPCQETQEERQQEQQQQQQGQQQQQQQDGNQQQRPQEQKKHVRQGQQQQQWAAHEVPSVTTEHLARRFLHLMCDERLIPTTWLDEGIQDPLYLQHPPCHYLLLEEQEAMQYPQLFRHRLKGVRADWRAHAQPVGLLGGRPVEKQGLTAGADGAGRAAAELLVDAAAERRLPQGR